MHRSLAALLVDPVTRTPLHLEEHETLDGEIRSGVFHGAKGRTYPIVAGIPRFSGNADRDQAQTERSFAFKWGRLDTYDSPGMRAETEAWLLKRYGFENVGAMRNHFRERGRVLDVGCGSGFTASLLLDRGWGRAEEAWVGSDISTAVDVAAERLAGIPGLHFVQSDLMNPPFAAGSFGAIVAEGVLHHTPSTKRALEALVPLLEPGGEMLFYVYRRKGPVREFTDDYVRALVSELPPEEGWESLRPLTRLAQALSELQVEVDVPEDVPVLGIKAGRQDVQRLLYWHFAKLFWNPRLSFEENLHVNFDWYAPRYAHRQTEEEVRRWCAEAGLEITRFDAEPSGFTVRALKA